MITCCSGSASVQLSMFADGKRLNPRTSKTILFISSRLPQSVFRRSLSPKDHVIFIFLPRIISPMHLCLFGNPSPNIVWNFNVLIKLCGLWSILRWTTLDSLHRFREVTHVTLFISNDLDWFACFRIQFLPDHIMIHSCLV